MSETRTTRSWRKHQKSSHTRKTGGSHLIEIRVTQTAAKFLDDLDRLKVARFLLVDASTSHETKGGKRKKTPCEVILRDHSEHVCFCKRVGRGRLLLSSVCFQLGHHKHGIQPDLDAQHCVDGEVGKVVFA